MLHIATKLIFKRPASSFLRTLKRCFSETSERPLAYVQKITKLEPIANADKIEVATIKGWNVVVGKGKYKPGDSIVYIEIDSIVPPKGVFVDDNLQRYNYRIKTVRLRQQVSQGYCLSLDELERSANRKIKLISPNAEGGVASIQDLETNNILTLEPDTNLTSLIGITKYEPYSHTHAFAGVDRAKFPEFLEKTDQQRIQNVTEYLEKLKEVEFEVTEKLDGMSITVFYNKDAFGICSRNYQLKITECESSVLKFVKNIQIEEKMQKYGKNIALQGEFLGPRVQNNSYKLQRNDWKIFDVYIIDDKRHATHDERAAILSDLGLTDKAVPFLEFKKIDGLSVKDIVAYADGKSKLNGETIREGVVFK